jgi:non-ribosomal peptide synthetase component F
LQGIFALLLARQSRLDKIVIGSVRNGRSSQLPQIENGLGLFINTLPLYIDLPKSQNWKHPIWCIVDLKSKAEELQGK